VGPAGGVGAAGRKLRWVAFGAVITAAVMDLLDSTIAQVAAPTIRRELGGSYAVIEWVTAAYALAMAVGLLTGGRLGDIFGRRRVLLTGMTGFVLASAACAAAQSAGELIAARAAQGLLGAIMLPQVFGLIRDMFEAHEMGKAFGVYGPVMGLSAMLGPIAAGGLISANVLGTGWRMIFLVNVPVGLAALALGARTLPAGSAGSGARKLDLPGAFIGSAAGGMAMARLGRRVLHAGLVVEAAGLLGIYLVLRGAGGGVPTADLPAPMVIGGIGMGMVFVPLFDIVMAGVRPQEMGSASGVLQTVNSLGMSLGIAGIGAIFFALAGGHGQHVPVYLHAAEWTALATVVLLAASFAVAFRLPRRARS
jgi:hypothetical protein